MTRQEEKAFPVYRKYPNNNTYFKIHSYSYFEEVKTMGGFYEVHTYQAEILPDRNLIEDMIQLRNNYWQTADEAEFEAFRRDCEANRQML